jgi:hypothetical protein
LNFNIGGSRRPLHFGAQNKEYLKLGLIKVKKIKECIITETIPSNKYS